MDDLTCCQPKKRIGTPMFIEVQSLSSPKINRSDIKETKTNKSNNNATRQDEVSVKKVNIDIKSDGENLTRCYKANCTCRQVHNIPGKAGYTYVSVVRILLHGHHFFAEKMVEARSTVFKLNLAGTRIMLFDSKSIRCLFQRNLICKEEAFGFQVYNKGVLDNYKPVIFQNNPSHDKTKLIFREYVNVIQNQFTISKLSDIIAIEFKALSDNCSINFDFEDIATCCMNNIICSILLGKNLHFPSMKLWLANTLVKKIYKPKVTEEVHTAYKRLIAEIQESLYFKLLKQTAANSMQDIELAKEMLFMSAFNALGALSSSLLSCIAYMIKLQASDKEKLLNESKQFLATPESDKNLEKLTYIEGFVLEILRLHPPAHKIFGVALKDFALTSEVSKYYIPKDTVLCGNIYHSQRSSNYFKNPNDFVLTRFISDPNLKEHLFTFGGDYRNQNIAQHHCVGQHLSMNILKLCVLHLCTYTIEHVTYPIWTGKKYKRLSASDKPLLIKSFTKR